MRDLQEETEKLCVMAGVKDLQVTVQSPKWTLLANLDVLVNTNGKRGVHMSRLVVPHKVECEEIEDFILEQSKTIEEKHHQKPYIKASFKFPWKDQFADIVVESLQGFKELVYTFRLNGITACPCSKETCGIGHMQRCSLEIKLQGQQEFETILAKMEACFSATLNEKLKRDGEAAVIVEAQENAKFAEDVTRCAVNLIPGIIKAESITEESIHSHRATSLWTKSMEIPQLFADMEKEHEGANKWMP